MKKLFLIISCCLFATHTFAQSIVTETEIGDAESAVAQTPIAIIPEPVSLMKKAGTFTLPENVTIQTVRSGELKQSITYLSDRITTATGKFVSTVSNSSHPTIKLILNTQEDTQLGKEGYK